MLNSRNRYRIPDYTVSTFPGLNTAFTDTRTLKPGVSPDSMNWLTSRFNDSIALRGGSVRLGQTKVTGNGKVSGIGIGIRYDGVAVPFFSYGRKVKYYDVTTDNTVEIGSNILPAAAATDDLWFAPYQSLAGSYIYYGSPNSSIYKTPVANPGSSVDQGLADYKFSFLTPNQGRFMAGGRKGSTSISNDKTGFYESYIDKALLSSYGGQPFNSTNIGSTDSSTKTFTGTLTPGAGRVIQPSSFQASSGGSTETFTDNGAGVLTGTAGGSGTINYTTGAVSVTFSSAPTTGFVVNVKYILDDLFGTGDGATRTFTHTLSLVSGRLTAMYIQVNDAAETFIDDRNGNLIGSQGGTGTVNYATGAVSVTFAVAPLMSESIFASYYTEDSASQGPLDFSGSAFGQGATFRQDDGGGNFMAAFMLNGVVYCMHLLRTWALTNASSSTDSPRNDPYRNVGIPYFRASYPTPEGIIFADLSKPSQPRFSRLQISPQTNNLTIEPENLSSSLDLSVHVFDHCVAFRMGDYDVFCVQEKVSGIANTYNSIMYLRDSVSGSWDRVDFGASCLADFLGNFLMGDAVSNNVFSIFSEFDDDGDPIDNHWRDGDMNLNTENLKAINRMVVKGAIQRDQNLEVWLSLDQGVFVKYYTILGSGDYVQQGVEVTIGSNLVGGQSIGGATAVTAHPFEIDFPVITPRFQTVAVMFVATAVGAVQVNQYTYKDIRDKGRKIPVTSTV